MATVLEHTFAHGGGTKRIRTLTADDGSVWSNAGDVAMACGYARLSSAVAACKGVCEQRVEADGETYFSLPTVLRVASRKGYNSFLRWVLRTISPLELPRLVGADPAVQPPPPESQPVLELAQASGTDIVASSSGSDLGAVMQALSEGVSKQIELQALAMSCRVLRESGMPYEMQQDVQRRLADKVVEMSHGDRADDYISAGQILLERGIPMHSVARLECEFGKDLMLVARKEKIQLPPMNLHKHHELKEGCCRVWHRVHHAELIEDVLESFRKRSLWGQCVSETAQRRFRMDLLQREGRGRRNAHFATNTSSSSF